MSIRRVTQEEAPFFAWAVTLGHKISQRELDACAALIDEKSRIRAGKFGDRLEATRFVLTKLLPRLVLWNEHPTIQPNHWVYTATRDGKQLVESPTYTSKVLGFDIEAEESLVAMAYCWGLKDQVAHVGISIMQLIPVIPPHKTGRELLIAHANELCDLEREALSSDPDLKEDVIIRRLCILLTLKRAFARAIGHFGGGYDYKRINCNIPAKSIYVDGSPLTGWEFRLSLVNLGVVRGTAIFEETYQCACATYRGGEDTTFLWDDNLDGKDKWLHFVGIDMILANLPKGQTGTGPGSTSRSTRGHASSSSATRRPQTRSATSSSNIAASSSSAIAGSFASGSKS